MHDSLDHQLNLAPGLHYPPTGPKDIGSARSPILHIGQSFLTSGMLQTDRLILRLLPATGCGAARQRRRSSRSGLTTRGQPRSSAEPEHVAATDGGQIAPFGGQAEDGVV
jgi:hypothetical protein